MAERFTTIIALAATALTALSVPAMAVAQSACNADGLRREDVGQGRLAVSVDGQWRLFAEYEEGPPPVLEIGGLQEVCVAWEAPPYRGANRQIVYASTRYRDEQPLWLFRNNAGAGIPFVGNLLGGDYAFDAHRRSR